MERIKKALERAKQERQSRSLNQKDTVVTTAHVQNVPDLDKTESFEKIEYTKTTVIDLNLRDKRVIDGIKLDPVTDAYKILRTRVLHRMRKNNWSSLIITSAGVGEGKSITAINLAISLAREVNNTVLLVDLDLRRPSVHKYFGYHPEHGIGDYLLSDVPLEKIMFNPSIERLVVIPCVRSYPTSSEILSSPKMKQLIEELKSRYPSRILIFDLPPVLVTDDALAFSPCADAVLLVAEDGKTQADELLHANDLLQSANIIGTVLNKAVVSRHTYYY